MEKIEFLQLSTSPVKSNIFNERYLYHINRDSFNKISAKALFEDEFHEKLFNEDSLYIIIGTDSGLLPQYIQEHGVPLGTRYLFVELESVLEQIIQYHLLDDDLTDEIILTSYSQWQEQAELLKLKNYSYLRHVSLFKSIGAQQANIADYTELNWKITEELQTLHFRNTTSLGCQTFIIQQINNIADNVLPAQLLKDVYQDKTAIVLGGGPSLSKILPWIRENQADLLIFSVSRLSKLLLENHIEPDFIISVDPQIENIQVSKEMFQFKKAIFLHSYHIDSSLANQWPGIKLYFGNRFPWKTKLNSNNVQAVGSTVSNTALEAAFAFGCDRILLAGVDLCFSKEGITHTSGTDESKIGPDYNNTSALELETYNGDKRTSDPDFNLALLSLENQAERISKAHKKVINLSKDAAKAKHIQYIPPEKIQLATQKEPALSIALTHIPALTPALKEKYYQDSLRELKKAIHQIQLIEKLAKKALKINDEMYNSQGIIENYKDKRTLDKIEKRLNSEHRLYSKLVKNFGVLSFIRITSPHDTSESWDAKKAKEIGKIYYESYQTGAQQLLLLLNAAVQRITIRQEESKENPTTISLLIEQWKKDKSYHRAAIWQQNHPDFNMPEDIKHEFDDLEKSFQEILNSSNTSFKQNLEKRSSLDLLKTKALILFRHHKKEELQNSQSGLALHYAKETEKEPYRLLISAYIAELDNQPELALDYYNAILNIDQSPLLEEALQQIVSLTIAQNKHSETLLALKCLSQLSPVYLPHYAESSKLTGDILAAIDSYTAYIEFFPDDTVTKLKLAHLYIDIKVYEAAELMLDLIIANAPNMETAIQLKAQIAKLKAGQ